MKKWLPKVILPLIVLIIAAVYYYVTLPAINIHASGFWMFVIGLVVVVLAIYAMRKRMQTVQELKKSKFITAGVVLILALVIVYAIGALLSSPIINAKKYRDLLQIEKRDYTEDITETDFSQIPLLDKASATLLGNRKMGSMVDMVSQFEVSDLYSQINYQGKPVRVTPLVYASTIKWLTNHSEGIPAYIMIDMATEETTLVKLDQPIKYSQSEYFNRNIYRHLRFKFPTYIFDELSFEIDEEGTPYWICPVKQFEIGLFGGQTIGKVVLCNAQTGECTVYDLEDCPTWVDKANPADLLIRLYNYYGTLVNGYINSIFSQKGCLQSTDGYNYMAMEDDVWVYTGVTSVSGDLSNVGFVLMNQRTRETRYYEVNGAEEHSAMESAEGQVQHLGYDATFPILVNVSDQPTYFMALKDSAGLVKQYAMVNIQQYQNVATGDTVAECKEQYLKLLNSNGIATEEEVPEAEVFHINGTISRIAQAVVDGNSHFYLTVEGSNLIFDVSVQDFVQVVLLQEGDRVNMDYQEGSSVCKVVEFAITE